MASLDEIQAMLDAATPGPWKQEGWRVSGFVPGCRPNGEILAECFIRVGAHTGHELDEANARLIAACPQLIQALLDVARAASAYFAVGADFVDDKRRTIEALYRLEQLELK